MKSSYDPNVDALYVRFTDDAIIETEVISPDLIVDYDTNGRIVGIEVMNATHRLAYRFAPRMAVALAFARLRSPSKSR